jgi:hypothetical protein
MIKHSKLYILLTVSAVFLVFSSIALSVCYQTIKTERHVRYVGMMNIAAENIAKTISGMEMNAMNVFDEVEKHLDSPESVIVALESKTHLNPDVRGYFAAFEPNFFKEKGTWFEPYVVHVDSSEFEVRMVGSARHNYHKSIWYVRAKQSSESFWADPYYYYDGTDISGHYTTFVKPISDANGRLACVCGADMTFEWLSNELKHIDNAFMNNELLNRYRLSSEADFYTVVINKDGSCIASPEGKSVAMTQDYLIQNLVKKKGGTEDMVVNGVPSTVYYGPIAHVDWSVAIVVAKQDIKEPLMKMGIPLLLVTVLGLIVVWLICRKLKYA